MKRRIKKVAVLGSGVMGSRIACHFANVGLEVLLLDIVPRELNEKEKAKGLTLEDAIVRNRIVNDALQFAIKSNPSPLYNKKDASKISTGNLDDDLAKIADCDWVLEAVIENLKIKHQVFDNVEKYRKPGTLITTNTSGIPIEMMLEGRSEDFQKHFCGTHFFNPPRYLKLLEIIPSSKTNQDVIAFLEDYGARILGKTMVLCKDTPTFIANRIGCYSIMNLFHTVEEMGMTVEEVDALTGPVIGRAKSATFRTCDVVGLDTMVHVGQGMVDNLKDDEESHLFVMPDYISKMVEKGMLGSKTKKGFYQKVKDENGKSQILALNLKTLEYAAADKPRFETVKLAKVSDDLAERMRIVIKGKDVAGEFYRKIFYSIFRYVSNRIPEITESLYKIDDAMGAGFGWEIGPFASWDALGVREAVAAMEAVDKKPAKWVYDMLDAGCESFYKIEDGQKKYYDQNTKTYKVIPGTENLLMLTTLKDKIIWSNAGSSIYDLGDGILNLEFHTKMNTINSDVIEGINKAIDLAEESYEGLVIYNEGQNFSAGADVGMIFMMAAQQDFDELNYAVKRFQDTMMRARYSSIPVVAAPHNLTLGGGCELCLHVDKVIAHAETYMGLVEFGIGVIPAGGGTKEFVLRLSDTFEDGDVRTNSFLSRFMTIGQAKVSTSAKDAFKLAYMLEGKDETIVSRAHQLKYAKQVCLQMADKGYVRPVERKDIKVLGNEGLGLVHVGGDSMKSANWISDHDAFISKKLGNVMSGGPLSAPTNVSESYLLDLERQAFVELCGEQKTLERIQSLVTTGKILRN